MTNKVVSKIRDVLVILSALLVILLVIFQWLEIQKFELGEVISTRLSALFDSEEAAKTPAKTTDASGEEGNSENAENAGNAEATEAPRSAVTAGQLPTLDVTDPKSVAVYFAACIVNGEYDKARTVAGKDGIVLIEKLENNPNGADTQKIISNWEKIADAFDENLVATHQGEDFWGYSFKTVDKVVLQKENGQYWVDDL